MSAVEIGQVLIEPRERSGGYREHKVISIGRKWITLKNGERCSIDGLMLDCGGYTPRQLYTSIAEYEAARKLNAAWGDFRRDLSNLWRKPESITVEQINEMRRMVGLEVLAASNKESEAAK